MITAQNSLVHAEKYLYYKLPLLVYEQFAQHVSIGV